jgi:hypothetical protein
MPQPFWLVTIRILDPYNVRQAILNSQPIASHLPATLSQPVLACRQAYLTPYEVQQSIQNSVNSQTSLNTLPLPASHSQLVASHL